MIWKNSVLSEISRIGDGAHASLKRINNGIPYLTAKNITKDGIDYSKIEYISEETYKKHFKEKSDALTQPRKDDILYSIIGSIGGVYVVKDEQLGISSSVALFRSNAEIINPQYLAYYLKSPYFSAQVQAIKGGVAQGFLSLGKLGSILITYPDDINYQEKIVKILSAYDNLIENNQKQIKLLEEAAQRLYKEWFVDFRFPGHEQVQIIDGVPAGWTVKTMDDICDSIGGGTPSTKNENYYINGKIKWVTPTDITKNNCLILLDTEKKITEDGLNHSSAKMVPAFSILMTSRASVGYFGICEHEVCTNQGFISCVPYADNMRFFLLFNLISRVEEIRGKATGSTFLEISKRAFRDMEVIIPTDDVLDNFTGMILPIIQKEISLKKSINLITEARNRLLPKLMSGEINF